MTKGFIDHCGVGDQNYDSLVNMLFDGCRKSFCLSYPYIRVSVTLTTNDLLELYTTVFDALRGAFDKTMERHARYISLAGMTSKWKDTSFISTQNKENGELLFQEWKESNSLVHFHASFGSSSNVVSVGGVWNFSDDRHDWAVFPHGECTVDIEKILFCGPADTTDNATSSYNTTHNTTTTDIAANTNNGDAALLSTKDHPFPNFPNRPIVILRRETSE